MLFIVTHFVSPQPRVGGGGGGDKPKDVKLQ
jgi:hypothetical protein